MRSFKGDNMRGEVKAVCISKKKGVKKQDVNTATLKEDFGIINDAHAGSSRQVSLLAEESIDKMRGKGLDISFGDFAENVVTRGIDLKNLAIATKIKIGKNVILEVTQIGKVCVSRCAIYYKTGDCIMPKEGIFAKVLKGGVIKVGDRLEVIKNV
jgi:MOSC domain-containing protein YiiM